MTYAAKRVQETKNEKDDREKEEKKQKCRDLLLAVFRHLFHFLVLALILQEGCEEDLLLEATLRPNTPEARMPRASLARSCRRENERNTGGGGGTGTGNGKGGEENREANRRSKRRQLGTRKGTGVKKSDLRHPDHHRNLFAGARDGMSFDGAAHHARGIPVKVA